MNEPAELLWLHAQVQQARGWAPGVADLDALIGTWSAIAAAQHGDLFGRAAAAACALAAREPFLAGNHATAAALAGVLLRGFELDLRLDAAEMPHLARLLAARHAEALADWLRAHTVPLDPP